MGLWWTCLRKSKKYYHPCFLVGPVVRGKPVEYFNRRVVCVLEADVCESGSYGAVIDAGGVIRDVQWMGRVTVPIEKHLSIVDNWVNDALDGFVGGISVGVIEAVQKHVDDAGQSPLDGNMMELDVFRAMIVNRKKDEVFLYRKPRSLP